MVAQRINFNYYYQTLLQVTYVLNSQRDTHGFWKAIADHIKEVIPWERAGITLYIPELDSFRAYAVETSLPKVVLQRDALIPHKGSAVGWVYDNREVHIRTDLQVHQEFVEDHAYMKEGLGRMINMPLLVRDGCLGTLNIGSVEAGTPHEEDLKFLGQVAHQIALAIDNVLAYEQIDSLRRQLAFENQYLHEEIKSSHNIGTIVGKSQALQKVQELAKAVAPTNSTVLLTGETGTGKELLAWLIHESSARRDGTFVRVNCAGLPVGLVEAELFGHERGAFTGAEQRKPGRFELANGGTLFLDEIGEMPPEAQAKLLRVMQDGLVDRVGGIKAVPVDVRIIAATNSDLEGAIAEGRFRADLFYRLHVFPISLPSLRDRTGDIPLLAEHFAVKYSEKFKKPIQEIHPDSMERLLQYSWPGNVRELQNVIERATILSKSPILQIDETLLYGPESKNLQEAGHQLKDLEKMKILEALERTDWRIDGKMGAAKLVGLHPSTLRSRLKKFGIGRPDKPSRKHS